MGIFNLSNKPNWNVWGTASVMFTYCGRPAVVLTNRDGVDLYIYKQRWFGAGVWVKEETFRTKQDMILELGIPEELPPS